MNFGAGHVRTLLRLAWCLELTADDDDGYDDGDDTKWDTFSWAAEIEWVQ